MIKGYWKLAGNSLDVSGNALNGSDFSMTYNTTGKYGIFNGTGYINFGDPAILEIGTGDFSVSLWFKFTTNYSGNYAALYSKGILVGSSNGGYGLFIDSNKLGVQIRYDASSLNSVIETTETYNDGKWHHAVMTLKRNDGNGIKLYVDGLLKGSASSVSYNGLTLNTQHNATLGCRHSKIDNTDPYIWAYRFTGNIHSCFTKNDELTVASVKNEYARVKGFF